MKSALLMGAGDLASLLAPRLKDRGIDVMGARRNPARLDVNWPVVKADASRLSDWQALLRKQPDVILLTLTPTEFSDAGYEQGYVKPVRALSEALEAIDGYQPLVVFVSSTSVYGQREGEWVNEDSPTEPTSFAGARVLQAEQLLNTHIPNHLIVRFSGIYGPGREGIVSRLLSGKVTVTPAWTNRIHSEDCAAVLVHLVNRYQADTLRERLYLASDDRPVRQAEFVAWLAGRLKFDPSTLPRSGAPGIRGSKRCDNARLRASGYQFIYPTFRDGYGHG